jgi:MOSC domain-containing protein YiiM
LDVVAKLASVQVGLPRTYGVAGAVDPMDKPWSTAFFKEPVVGPVKLRRTNLAGDRQADLEVHGGPDKAVNVYAGEHYPEWERELGIERMPHGAFGENFTTQGLLEDSVCVGDVYAVSDALVEVSQPRQPCWKLARRWRIKELTALVQQSGRTGWYFRVLREGTVEAGAALALQERPYPEWTIAACNRVMYHGRHDAAANRALAGCPALSESWRAGLLRRAEAADLR